MDKAKSSFNIERGYKNVNGGEKFCVWLGAFSKVEGRA